MLTRKSYDVKTHRTEEANIVALNMQMAIQEARKGLSAGQVRLVVWNSYQAQPKGIYYSLQYSPQRHTQNPVGCIVVDPSTNNVIASGYSQSKFWPHPSGNARSHPLRHAAIGVIDSVGVVLVQRQGTGEEASETEGFSINSPENREPNSGLPYICTGLDLYITVEPCMM